VKSIDRNLSKSLGYEFSDSALLELALTHRSFGNHNNERLEFLGDSLVNMIIAEALYRQLPKAREGQLSRLRANLVKGSTLAELGKGFGLGDYLRLGSGELKSGGYRRESILADVVESIIGAIYLDANFDTCKQCVLRWYESRLQSPELATVKKDPKTQLQEFLQKQKEALPEYEVVNIQGADHNQTFKVTCQINLLDDKTEGSGSSRRLAEQQAAYEALVKLGQPT